MILYIFWLLLKTIYRFYLDQLDQNSMAEFIDYGLCMVNENSKIITQNAYVLSVYGFARFTYGG